MDASSLFVFNTRVLIGTIIGAVFFTLLSYFVWLPTPIAGIFFFPSYALLGFFAVLLGPVPGALISLVGMLFIGVLHGDINASYTIASVVCGFSYGLAKKFVHADEGKFGYEAIVAFNLTQVVGNLVSWAFVAPVLEMLFNPGNPVVDTFLRGLMAAFVDILSAEFFGTPLLFVYSLICKRRIRSSRCEHFSQ